MEGSKLYNLIRSIEYGTKLHISVVFLDDAGNTETYLPLSHNFHFQEICVAFKSLDNQVRCIKCRNIVLKKAVRYKKPFGGICVNGVYEYCYPVVLDEKVICVVFVGNILPPPSQKERLFSKITDFSLIDSLELDFSEEKCKDVAETVGSYISFLVREYTPKNSENYNPLIENIKNYIEENLIYDFAVCDISKIFNYNEKYLGKLFKLKTGMSIKEYINFRRIQIACGLLKNTYLSITDISIRSGFNNVTYFNRIFKKEKGVTPSVYRGDK